MTALSDTIQIALGYGLPGAMIIALAGWIAWRSFWAVWAWLWAGLKKALPPLKWSSLLWGGFAACLLYVFSTPIIDWFEYMEQVYFEPVAPGQVRADTAQLIAIYEDEIRRHTSPAEFQIVRDSTRATAERIGSTPVAIYEAAYLECGLNPFRVRDDRVAAGWIQFTRVGLQGLGVSLEQAISACQRRDAALIMRLTDTYLRRKADRLPQGVSLANTIDLYLAIFAPAHIGAGPDRVVYAGFSNPAYYKNSGLDGWHLDNGVIVRGRSRVDGKITAYEIYLALERKKALLLKNGV